MNVKPGMAFSFLITSPLVHEVALIMVWQLFGWKLALFYLFFSLGLGIVGGLLMEHTKIGHELIVSNKVKTFDTPYIERLSERWKKAFTQSLKTLKKLLPLIILGITIGSFIHDRDLGFITEILANNNGPLQVLIAVVVGIPLYSGVAVGIPVAFALIGQGLGLGTGIAFILSVAGLSLPELIMLKGVMSKKLLATFTLYIAIGMLIAGTVLNTFQHVFI
jgi:uncharacterized membrane protein YraQ (UPF0718 family)